MLTNTVNTNIVKAVLMVQFYMQY